jgi:octaheme c-type cytochrome (tetrathionate reductase family)
MNTFQGGKFMRNPTIVPVALFALLVLVAAPAWAAVDHSQFVKGPLQTAPDVTKKCIQCHEDAAEDMMKTTHWTWKSKQEIPGKGMVERGKKNAINNFCINISANWPRCTSCHAGYGWKDASFDFTDKTKVDCLMCHDTTGTYEKEPKGAGMPKEGVDLLHVAQNVGKPSRKNCGDCHFYGGGGEGVKHGDLDSSLLDATSDYDVHMGKDGADFTCQDCHKTENHSIKGNAMVVSPGGNDHLKCTDCHDARPHKESLVNGHTDTVACQTCHIPRFAKSLPTKLYWDWSQAGQDIEIDATMKQYGMPTCAKKKGSFVWGKNIAPQYRWYNGTGGAYLLGEKIDPGEVALLSWPVGDIGDAKSKIYPFKLHKGKQIYDKKNEYLIVPHLFGKGGYWKTYDWDSASKQGMETVGLPYSGEYGFAETAMYWKLNHMVVPGDKALGCLDCHGDSGRLDWEALGYEGDPMKSGGRKL